MLAYILKDQHEKISLVVAGTAEQAIEKYRASIPESDYTTGWINCNRVIGNANYDMYERNQWLTERGMDATDFVPMTRIELEDYKSDFEIIVLLEVDLNNEIINLTDFLG